MSDNLKAWQYRLFYLTLFLLPVNLAKHFPVASSYVSGVLVDYLIPTVYLTDILIIILLALWFKSSKLPKKSPLTIFLLLLLPAVIFSTSQVPAFYKWLKFAEMAGLTLWIKAHIDWRKQLPRLALTLAWAILLQSLLALIQWFKQASVFGYWFLGEQPYSSLTPGVNQVTWLDGSLKLPPLGTTPHPNVLAGLIVTLLPFVFYGILRDKKNKLIYLMASLLGLTTLFLTFSLSAWLALVLIVLPFGLRQVFKLKPVVLLGYLILITSLILGFWSRFDFLAPQSSFLRRSQLAQMATQMFRDRPLTGVGVNNFTVLMENYGVINATTRFLQPVHNIYLLVLSESGIIGLMGLLYLLYRSFKTEKPMVVTLSLFTLLFLGLFDHYPLTIQQGLIMLFLLI